MATAKPAATTRTSSSSRGGSDPFADKRLTSGRISSDVADFVKSGGKVEILGITRDWYKPSAPTARSNKSAAKAPTAVPGAAPVPPVPRKRTRTPVAAKA